MFFIIRFKFFQCTSSLHWKGADRAAEALRDFTAKIKGATIFSCLDLLAAFFQIPLTLKSSQTTTTLTPWGAWRYKRLAMGLKNSAQSYQRLMQHIFQEIPNSFVYIDDILLFSKSDGEHQNLVDQALGSLKKMD